MGIKVQASLDEKGGLGVKVFVREPFGPPAFKRETTLTLDVNFDHDNRAPAPKVPQKYLNGTEDSPPNLVLGRRVANAIIPTQIDLLDEDHEALETDLADALEKVRAAVEPLVRKWGRKAAAVANLAAETHGEFDEAPETKENDGE